ncbi:MAG: aspartate aminotransferase family protein [Pyrinomonadaceae bacterium]|jgi:acetylornithine/succinyldiaminopimelate/putrescine aminotransferase
MNFEAIKEIEEQYQLATYKKMSIAAECGEGCFIWDCEGRRYLDLYGGHAVCATGHAHPAVATAISEQASRLIFYSNIVFSEIRALAASRLVELAPPSAVKAFFCNSGTEANENAMRMARLATGREKIISFTGSFHGRTADSISATFLGNYRNLGRPNVPGHAMADFGNIESLINALDTDTAAVILEPIQSMAGVREAEPEFFVRLRQECDRVGAILIFDEVQTGIGRTGRWFFSGSDLSGGIEADIISLAKSLGSGIPVGACIVNQKIAEKIKENDLGTTFGGGMIAMAAIVATLNAIESEEMIANAAAAESYLRNALENKEHIRSIRGKGCLLGIEFDKPCGPVFSKLLENGVITGTSSDPNVLRLLPPLIVNTDQLDEFIEKLDAALSDN